MTAGLPGSGIGGLFYLLSALFMPLRELWRALRSRSRPERPVLALQQAGLALGIIAALWWTGWAIDHWLLQPAFARSMAESVVQSNARVPSVFQVSTFAVGLGTLAVVVGGTRILAALVPVEEPRRRAARKRKAERLRRVAIIVFAVGAALSPTLVGAQTPDDARRLARSGRRDAAIVEYERWLRENPRDFVGWRELGNERMRAERYAEAIAAYDHALTLQDDEGLRSRLDYARSRMGFSLVTTVNGSRDSDGLYVVRGGITGDGPLADRWRYGVTGNRLMLGDAASSISFQETTAWTRWRPLHAFRVEAMGGLIHDLDWMARVRARWTAPANGALADVRVSRTPLTTSSALVANEVVMEEARATLETPGRLRLRGLVSQANLNSSLDSNQRTRLGAGLVFRATPLLETSLSVQRTTHSRPTQAGYFAPAIAELAELGTYVEFYGPGDVSWAFDAGAGVHRYTAHDTVFSNPGGHSIVREAATTDWQPALRAWGQVSVPLHKRLDLLTEVDFYQSAAAAAVATSADWRFVSAGLSVRWYLQAP